MLLVAGVLLLLLLAAQIKAQYVDYI